MDINFVADVMLIIIVVIWTMMILLLQIVNFSTRTKVPYEIFGKVLNLFIHIILVFTMWLNILVPGTTISWILIVFSALLLVLWIILSRYQRKYIEARINRLKRDIERSINKLKNEETKNAKKR